MKKLLNGLGVFGSIISTIILAILIFIYCVILNIKFTVSEKGMASTFKKIDVVEMIKNVEDGTMWEDFMQLSDTLNLNEKQFEQILNNNVFKEQMGSYFSRLLSSAFNDKNANLTKEELEEILNFVILEYNKVNDTKITDIERQEIINSFNDEIITNINEELGSINLKKTVEPQYIQYIEFINNLLYGNYTLIILVLIIAIIGLIALFRFSLYKLISYVKTSTIISESLLLILGILLLVIPLEDMEIIMPIRKIFAIKLFITSGMLFILSIGLSFFKKNIKKEDNKTDKTEDKKENKLKEEKTNNKKKIEKEEKKNDKKIIIFTFIILLLLLVIIYLIFGINRSYTVTFDTDGGSLITNIEVKNNEVVNLPEPPKKEGYKFVGWTNEDGKIITKGTKFTDDVTLKAKWISNDVKTISVEFDTDGANKIDNILIEKDKNILFPIEPTKEGYIFVGWVDENNNIIIEDTTVNKNIILKAIWIKEGSQVSTIKFDTDGGSKVDNIIIENGKIILLPVNPIKTGYVFAGWVDENGNSITKDTIVKENMIIKAIWKEPYTCPSDCTPTGDGSECTKTITKEISNISTCPSGYTLKNGICVDMSSKYHANSIDSAPWWTCNSSSEYMYNEIDNSGLGAFVWCVKKANKVTTKGCPSGYKKSENKCVKTETIKCKTN